jgi:2,3-bisphosphoglycerate-independent phosphoglycerate mutase
MVWENAPEEMKDLVMTPPHDISDKATEGHLPKGPGADELIELMARSRDILKEHPVNKSRVSDGNKPASSIWLWGNGFAPRMPTMKKRFGVEGALISAVDLMKGIGVYAGMEILDVPGATGYLDTNYAGKVEYASHNGNLEDKIRGIEDFDSEVVAGILEGIEDMEFTLLVLNDHPTPVELKTHTSDPVPFAICTSADMKGAKGPVKFSEEGAGATGLLIKDCEEFAASFFGK